MLNTLMLVLTWAIGVLGGGSVVAMIVTMVALGPAAVVGIVQPILTRFLACAMCVASVVFVLATVGAYWVGRHGEYERGYKAALAHIAVEDEQAINGAWELRQTWKDCRTRGGKWDQSTGVCQ
ncbi:hypothetical protein ACE10Z_23710 [Bradyrhizobium sp. Pha-3]|uniref:hypothetical protein n=1 Tax=Bradyrhizobium sp. Pha-3 TaxID=208375 RepID=UPI0035D4CEC3